MSPDTAQGHQVRHLSSHGECRRKSGRGAEEKKTYANGRCCRKSRKLSSSRNLAKDSVCLPPPLQASVRRVRSSVVAFLRFDVVQHIGAHDLHRRRRKIWFTCQKNRF